MRKLASIQEIVDLQPIEGADKIEVASVLGWKVVAEKGLHQVGAKVVYCEIDSQLPDRPEFEFLRPYGFRIKTIRLRGQISQGICFPLSVLPEGSYEVGDDVTDVLGVQKWEPQVPSCLSGKVRCHFPGWCPKTDETRVQSYPEILDELRGVPCYSTVKIDGTSTTYMHQGGEIHVCSRRLSYVEDSKNAHWQNFHKLKLAEKLPAMGDVCIQGETAGPGIQRNPAGYPEICFQAFQIYGIRVGRYLGFHDFITFCDKWEIPTVPIARAEFTLDHTVEQLLEMAKGQYRDSRKPREGIVIRPITERYSQVLNGRASFKVINNDFLLGKKSRKRKK